MWNDVRYALRVFSRAPGFALTAVVTLAVGIGATTGVYSIYSAVLLRPLPFASAERIVAIWVRDPAGRVYGISGHADGGSFASKRRQRSGDNWNREDSSRVGESPKCFVERSSAPNFSTCCAFARRLGATRQERQWRHCEPGGLEPSSLATAIQRGICPWSAGRSGSMTSFIAWLAFCHRPFDTRRMPTTGSIPQSQCC